MVTLGDVAKAAGTSTTTVSRVLNGCGDTYRISARTQTEVLAAAKRLGYRPSYHARALKAGRSQTIGLMCHANILSGAGHGYFGQIIDGINRVVRGTGYNLLLTSDDDRSTTLQQGVAFWKEQRVDALITFGFVIGPYLTAKAPREFEVPDLPLVLIESQHPLDYPVVEMHYDQAMNDAVAHLAELGHRELVYLCPASAGPDRSACFEAASSAHQLQGRVVTFVAPPDCHDQTEVWQRIASSAEAIDRVWAALANCSGILCWNDETALALQQVLHQRGLRIPEDRSIIGFDDIFAQTALPPMSTISHNLVEMGQRAGEIALAMAAAPQSTQDWRQQRIPVEATFIPRASTAAIQPLRGTA